MEEIPIEESSSEDGKSDDEEWENLIPVSKKLCADWIKFPKESGVKAKKKARPLRPQAARKRFEKWARRWKAADF